MSKPKIAESAFIAPGAVLCGDVTVGENCGVYANASIRADFGKIVIGNRSNIQDGCILHANPQNPLIIGEGVSVGHGAIVHGCIIHDNVLVGMGAIVMDGVEIGENTLIGAGALITQKKKIPPNSMVMGSPAKVIRELTPEEVAFVELDANHYAKSSAAHKAGEFEYVCGPIGSEK